MFYLQRRRKPASLYLKTISLCFVFGVSNVYADKGDVSGWINLIGKVANDVLKKDKSNNPQTESASQNSSPTPKSVNWEAKTYKDKVKNFEVKGLRLGMPPSVIEQVIKNNGGQVKISTHQHATNISASDSWSTEKYPGILKGTIRKSNGNYEEYEIVFQTPVTGNTAMEIYRKMSYQSGQRPTYQKIIDSFISKYGKPSHIVGNPSTPFNLYWYTSCPYDLTQGTAIRPKETYHKGCTAILSVALNRGSTSSTVSTISMALFDYSDVAYNYQAKNEHENKLRKSAAQKAENNSVSPDL